MDVRYSTDDKYKIVNGTYYNRETPNAVIQWLETSRKRKQRIRIFYGNVETGLSWLDEYNTIGTIGRSTGPQKIPILIQTSRSLGGEVILEHCIIRIDIMADTYSGHQCVYSNNFHTGIHTITRHAPLISQGIKYPHTAMQRKDDGTDHLVANFETAEKMQRYDDFINGRSWKH